MLRSFLEVLHLFLLIFLYRSFVPFEHVYSSVSVFFSTDVKDVVKVEKTGKGIIIPANRAYQMGGYDDLIESMAIMLETR